MKQRGITLVELLITLAVLAIVLALAVPGYGSLVNNVRLSNITNEMITSLNLARSEAIKRGARVSICKTSNPMGASPACNPDGTWQQGWLIFVDRGTSGVIDGTDSVFMVQEGSTSAVITGGTNFGKYISYMPSGVSRGQTGLPTGTLNICLDGSNRKIILNSTGRIKLESGKC